MVFNRRTFVARAAHVATAGVVTTMIPAGPIAAALPETTGEMDAGANDALTADQSWRSWWLEQVHNYAKDRPAIAIDPSAANGSISVEGPNGGIMLFPHADGRLAMLVTLREAEVDSAVLVVLGSVFSLADRVAA